MRLLLALFALSGCAGQEEAQTCDLICDELVLECGYSAYPTRESCLQGCLYKTGEGAKMDRARDCILAAECDTFEIIECEHAEGVDVE